MGTVEIKLTEEGVFPNHMKLQINGEIVGEKPLSSNKEPSSNDLRKIVLANIGGDGNISHGYMYNFQVFPSISSIKDHHMKVIGMKEYEERVVSLALSRPKLQALTNKLKSVRMTCPLFDTARWVRNLERGYLKMWNLHCSGQRPQHFKVTKNDLEYPYDRYIYIYI
ncbi:hypothetical protein Ahy_B03g063883 isoform A [Arachis hypogaea]|uniref:Uncharacterized protein n=3 Tax=Arachis hypogaea TaxID=3818 RepID=A0A444ZYF1_ARAHY|nr:hypothetical protein Ahy_B03g063883 isoform A [Arachis hypogaea]